MSPYNINLHGLVTSVAPNPVNSQGLDGRSFRYYNFRVHQRWRSGRCLLLERSVCKSPPKNSNLKGIPKCFCWPSGCFGGLRYRGQQTHFWKICLFFLGGKAQKHDFPHHVLFFWTRRPRPLKKHLAKKRFGIPLTIRKRLETQRRLYFRLLKRASGPRPGLPGAVSGRLWP